MSRAFVSYSRRNTNFAERLSRDLTDAGVEVWIDFRQIHAGERWKDEIRRGIERSDVMIIVLSPDSVESEWVRFEIDYGREQGKILLPVMAADAIDALRQSASLRWLLDVHFIAFENRYEQAFPELLKALPGKRRVSPFDSVDPAQIPNPFKGLEAFQQTDAAFFFGREQMVKKALAALKPGRQRRFLAVVGASGSGKSSLVRAGVIPQVRAGMLPGSAGWRVAIFTPGEQPVRALATRLAPLLPEEVDADAVREALVADDEGLSRVALRIMTDAQQPNAMLLLVVDQFEETFTRAGEAAAQTFIDLLYHAATVQNGRCIVVLTMRADFFDRLGRYPEFAELFEADQLLIVTEMTPANLLRAITGPADAVGLIYEDGLADRILDDVRRQPGSLPLLQYALSELYQRRDGRRLTNAAYDAIGGVEQALARHAEGIFTRLGAGQQDIVRRLLLRLVEVAEDGTTTRRRVARSDLVFMGISQGAVQEVIDLLTAPETRLLVTSREISATANQTASATVWVEVSHEALIHEWERFQDWIEEDLDDLRLAADLLKGAMDWLAAGKDPAYLLTGTRLDRAEEWLEHADATVAQREFVRASVDERERREEGEREQAERELGLQMRAANRLRAFVGVLVLALLVTAGLVLFAFSERDRAETNEAEARRQADLAATSQAVAEQNLAQANSFALSALADRALGDGDGELAVALAVEANLIAAPPPPQARLILADVAFAPGTRQVFDHRDEAVRAVALSRDESLLLAAGPNGVSLYDARSGERLRSIGGDNPLLNITAVAVSPDGTTALTGSESGAITAWDIATGEERFRFARVHDRNINSLRYDTAGERVVSTGGDTRVVVWDAATGTERSRHGEHNTAASGAVFWPVDERLVISTGRDGRIIAYNAATGSVVMTITTDLIAYSLDVSPDGAFALIGGGGQLSTDPARVALWSLATVDPDTPRPNAPAAPVREFEPPSLAATTGTTAAAQANAVAFAAGGNLIVAALSDGQLLTWETATGAQTGSFVIDGVTALNALAASADGDQAISGGAANGAAVLRLWDVINAAVVIDMTGYTGSADGMFHPDGRTIITSGRTSNPDDPDSPPSDTLRVFDIASGRTVQQITGHSGLITAIDVSPDGRFAVTGSVDSSVRVWNIADGTGITVGEHRGQVADVVFMPDGQTVASVGFDGRIVIWDANEPRSLVREFSDPARTSSRTQPRLQSLAVSPDGSMLLTGGEERTVNLWDAATSEHIAAFTIEDRAVRDLNFSTDGQMIVVGTVNGSLTIWNIDETLVRRLTGHTRAIRSVEFSPDGSTLLSSGFDGTLRLWDLNTGLEVRRYDTNNEPGVLIQSATVSADGQTVLTGLSDGRMRVWRLYPTLGSLLAWTVVNRHVRELDCIERGQLLPPCDENGDPPPRVLPDLPELNPPPESILNVAIGTQQVVNTTDGERQNVRSAPGALDGVDIVGQLDDGEVVEVVDGPQLAAGFWWWEVRTPDGLTGWVTEYIPDENIQTLVPVEALE